MARLPQQGGDSGTWGNILNDYLSQSHNSDGSLKDNVVGSAQIITGSVTKAAVGLGSVDNTTDVNKPVSSPQQAALDLKVDISGLDSLVATRVNTSNSAVRTAVNSAIQQKIDDEGGVTGEQGPPGLVWRGTYSNATTYGKNDAVYHAGRAFIALQASTGVNPPTSATSSSTWSLLVDRGDTGAATPGSNYGDNMFRFLAGGEANYNPTQANSNSIALQSGVVIFGPANVAQVSETITSVSSITGGTAASGTTFAGYAVYSIADNGDATLVAQTASDTTSLWNITFQGFKGINVKKNFTSSFQKVAGTRYSVAVLYVGSTPPTLGGNVSSVQDLATNFMMPFRAAKSGTGQSSFPSTLAATSMTGFTHTILFGLLAS